VLSSKERRESERKLTSTVLHQSLSLPLGARLLTPYVNFRSLRSSCAASKDLFPDLDFQTCRDEAYVMLRIAGQALRPDYYDEPPGEQSCPDQASEDDTAHSAVEATDVSADPDPHMVNKFATMARTCEAQQRDIGELVMENNELYKENEELFNVNDELVKANDEGSKESRSVWLIASAGSWRKREFNLTDG